MCSLAILENALIEKLRKHHQMHVLRYWDELDVSQQRSLCAQLSSIDFETLDRAICQSKCVDSSKALEIKPIENSIVESAISLSESTRNDLFELGLRELANGTVGLIVLAGGQGTRLNTTLPKGIFDLGLLSHKVLFQLQAEKIIRLKQLIVDHFGKDAPSIPWYIMTSEHTLADTRAFFESNHFFNYPEADVIFFEQNHLPAIHFDHKLSLIDKYTVGMAPDGNGGLFSILESSGVIEDMRKRGVDYLHVCSVDNVLVRTLDPIFIGYSISKQADCSVKVIRKQKWNEALGVVCKCDSSYQVVEYNEIDPDLASKIDEKTGNLEFWHGNICVHFFSRSFLEDICKNHLADMKFHVARKKMPAIALDTGLLNIPKEANVFKFEKFIFDVIPFSKNFRVWEVSREEEFSPLKNGLDSFVESPISCRRDLERLHLKWLRNAGILDKEFPSPLHDETDLSLLQHARNIVEVSPLVSYSGERIQSYPSLGSVTLRISATQTLTGRNYLVVKPDVEFFRF